MRQHTSNYQSQVDNMTSSVSSSVDKLNTTLTALNGVLNSFKAITDSYNNLIKSVDRVNQTFNTQHLIAYRQSMYDISQATDRTSDGFKSLTANIKNFSKEIGYSEVTVSRYLATLSSTISSKFANDANNLALIKQITSATPDLQKQQAYIAQAKALSMINPLAVKNNVMKEAMGFELVRQGNLSDASALMTGAKGGPFDKRNLAKSKTAFEEATKERQLTEAQASEQFIKNVMDFGSWLENFLAAHPEFTSSIKRGQTGVDAYLKGPAGVLGAIGGGIWGLGQLWRAGGALIPGLGGLGGAGGAGGAGGMPGVIGGSGIGGRLVGGLGRGGIALAGTFAGNYIQKSAEKSEDWNKFFWGRAAGGAVRGAAIGSMVGPWGTLIGGAIGAIHSFVTSRSVWDKRELGKAEEAQHSVNATMKKFNDALGDAAMAAILFTKTQGSMITASGSMSRFSALGVSQFYQKQFMPILIAGLREQSNVLQKELEANRIEANITGDFTRVNATLEKIQQNTTQIAQHTLELATYRPNLAVQQGMTLSQPWIELIKQTTNSQAQIAQRMEENASALFKYAGGIRASKSGKIAAYMASDPNMTREMAESAWTLAEGKEMLNLEAQANQILKDRKLLLTEIGGMGAEQFRFLQNTVKNTQTLYSILPVGIGNIMKLNKQDYKMAVANLEEFQKRYNEIMRDSSSSPEQQRQAFLNMQEAANAAASAFMKMTNSMTDMISSALGEITSLPDDIAALEPKMLEVSENIRKKYGDAFAPVWKYGGFGGGGEPFTYTSSDLTPGQSIGNIISWDPNAEMKVRIMNPEEIHTVIAQ